MVVFTFGNGAKDSTLIRTDKYGIQVKKILQLLKKIMLEKTLQEVEIQFYTQMVKTNISITIRL